MFKIYIKQIIHSTVYNHKSISVQFSSIAQSCPTLCDPMNCSMQASLWLLQDIDYSFLCYTVGSCCLSILYLVACMYKSQAVIIALPYYKTAFRRWALGPQNSERVALQHLRSSCYWTKCEQTAFCAGAHARLVASHSELLLPLLLLSHFSRVRLCATP